MVMAIAKTKTARKAIFWVEGFSLPVWWMSLPPIKPPMAEPAAHAIQTGRMSCPWSQKTITAAMVSRSSVRIASDRT